MIFKINYLQIKSNCEINAISKSRMLRNKNLETNYCNLIRVFYFNNEWPH